MLSGLPSILPETPSALWADLEGFSVRPGIIDLHGDGFERHLAPRRGVLKDLKDGLFALDAELAANGITTAYLAQFWSWEGGIRRPPFATRMVEALAEIRPKLRTEMRVQLRVETHLIDEFQDVLALVAAHDIPYVVYNDHLPHKALAAGKRPPRLTGQALKSRRSPEAHLALLQELHARGPLVPAALSDLSDQLSKRGVALGSHDDRTEQDRAIFRAMGAGVAEFPETAEAAVAARAGGDTILMGAPNVVRGNSHDRGVNAREMIAQGLCDVLVSDYHYPALRAGALWLEQNGTNDAWDMVSTNAAKALGLTDRGALRGGLRSDLCVLDGEGRVQGTMVAGRWSYLAGPLVECLAG